MMTRHIFITGMTGSGKTTLGRRVAKDLHLPFIDVDQMIVDIAGCPVTEIFAKYGEPAFRAAETNALIAITRMDPAIVSTGGGLVMNDINRMIMQNYGYIVLIDRPLENIRSDIKLDRRPMLAAKGLDEVDRLYHLREETYHSCADAVVDNSRGFMGGVMALTHVVRML